MRSARLKSFVLDANAFLDLLLDRPGADRIEKLIRQARAQEQKATLVTGDRDFVSLGKSIRILWLAAR